MRYRRRHRQVVRRQRLRAALTVAAVTSSALVAPLAVSGPAPSDAATSAAFDTLLNHPEWRLSSGDADVAAQIVHLTQTLTERGIAYDPATIGAYRVPTVEGFTTFVTAKPDTFTVRPNPNLLSHTPEGDTAVSPREVLARLLEPSAEPQAGVGGVGGGIPSTYLMTSLFNTVWGTVEDALATDFNALVNYGITTVGQLVNDSGPLVTQLLLLIDAAQAEAQRQAAQIIAIGGPLIDQAVLTANAWLAEAQRIASRTRRSPTAAHSWTAPSPPPPPSWPKPSGKRRQPLTAPTRYATRSCSPSTRGGPRSSSTPTPPSSRP